MEEKEYKYLVGVECMTFNQSKYITDALNGFVMQETNFPFVVMVVDDASTDGEQEVIRQFVEDQFDLGDTNTAYEKETDYAHITYAQHKTNKNCYFAVLYLKENHYSQNKDKLQYLEEWREYVKYLALCEGDDYWIHPQKLQMQVKIFENNPNYTLCFHSHKTLHDKTGEIKTISQYSSDVKDVPQKDMILGGGGFMATNSMFFPIKAIQKYPKWATEAPIGDLPLMLVLMHRGKTYYINQNMSIYRINALGSWTSKNISNFKRQKKHHYAIIKLWKEFNLWTNKKYNTTIRQKIIINKKEYFKLYINSFIKYLLIFKN